MLKKTIALILCISTLCGTGAFDSVCYAKKKLDDNIDLVAEEGGFLATNDEVVKRIYENKFFTAPQGHGFAAERANNLYDSFKGIKGEVVGDDFLKNGPDRKIISKQGLDVQIQDKYYRSAKASVEAAFDEDGMFKYVDADQMPMKLEVPKDQYDEAVKLIQDKIIDGKIKNITDPEEAKNIVKKGNVTYKEAVNISKAGNIDSLIYDAANGIVTSTCAAGIAFTIDYALCLMNGLAPDVALENAMKNGIKTGGIVFATFIISSQIAKTGVVKAMVPTAEALTKTLGKNVYESILVRTGKEVAGKTTAEMAKSVSQIISKELITDGVFVVVLTALDVSDLLRGRISKEELLKNLTITIVSTAVGTAGGYAGGALGQIVLPGAGAAIGTIAGSVVAGGITVLVSELVADKIYKSDADEMYEIISREFQNLGETYFINEKEGACIVEELGKELQGDILKDMYESDDRNKFAKELMEPLFLKQVGSREKIVVPSEQDLRIQYKAMMKEIVFVH